VALRVHGGEAKLTINNKKATIKSGEMVYLQDIFKPEKFKPVVADALHQWAARRSYDLCTANIFNTKPKRPENLAWKPTAKAELENIQYHISFPQTQADEEYRRLQIGEWQRQQQELQQQQQH